MCIARLVLAETHAKHEHQHILQVEGEVKVVATASDPNVGARNMDKLLFDVLRQAIDEKYKVLPA